MARKSSGSGVSGRSNAASVELWHESGEKIVIAVPGERVLGRKDAQRWGAANALSCSRRQLKFKTSERVGGDGQGGARTPIVLVEVVGSASSGFVRCGSRSAVAMDSPKTRSLKPGDAMYLFYMGGERYVELLTLHRAGTTVRGETEPAIFIRRKAADPVVSAGRDSRKSATDDANPVATAGHRRLSQRSGTKKPDKPGSGSGRVAKSGSDHMNHLSETKRSERPTSLPAKARPASGVERSNTAKKVAKRNALLALMDSSDEDDNDEGDGSSKHQTRERVDDAVLVSSDSDEEMPTRKRPRLAQLRQASAEASSLEDSVPVVDLTSPPAPAVEQNNRLEHVGPPIDLVSPDPSRSGQRPSKHASTPRKTPPRGSHKPAAASRGTPGAASAASTEEDSCAICLMGLSSSSMGQLPCPHLFHFSCIYQWSGITNLCPLCKQEFTSIVEKSTTGETKEHAVSPKKQRPPESLDFYVPQGGCMFCGADDNEDVLLLCDGEGCETYCHTYCCNPPLTHVPEDDWYCQNCLAGWQENSGSEYDPDDEVVIDLASPTTPGSRSRRTPVSGRFAAFRRRMQSSQRLAPSDESDDDLDEFTEGLSPGLEAALVGLADSSPAFRPSLRRPARRQSPRASTTAASRRRAQAASAAALGAVVSPSTGRGSRGGRTRGPGSGGGAGAGSASTGPRVVSRFFGSQSPAGSPAPTSRSGRVLPW